MKKILTLCIFLSALCLDLFGQASVTVPSTGCPINTVTTNPDKVPGAFDWRTQNFIIYLTSQDGTPGVATTIVNPFFDQSLNPTTFTLANDLVKDFAPVDGWELLYKSFGTPQQGVKTPFFVLYNKYNGTVRVFANIINSGEFAYTAAGIKLSYDNPSNTNVFRRQTALLNQLGATTFSMEQLQRKAVHFKPTDYLNSGVNNNYYWLYADFFALFDPCTCGLQSDWYLEVGLINNIDVNLTINGLIQQTMVDANPNGDPDETELGGFFGKVQQYLAFGSGIVDGINGTLKSGNEGKKKGDALLKNADSLLFHFEPIIGKDKSQNIARSIGKILYELPKVNMVMNLAKTLITTVKKLSNDYQALDEPQSVDAMGNTSLTEYKTELTVNGTLTVNGGYVETALKVPGAQLPPGTGNVEAYKPIYDNILGVFNLFEQPRFQLTKYRAPDVDIISYWSFQNYDYTISNDLWPVFPEINQLMIKTPPKLVINPAARLKLKSVDYQIVFENQESNEIEPISLQGPMIPGPLTYHQSKFGEGPYHARKLYEPSITNREKLMSSMGYELEILSNSGSWNGASIATPYLNQNCFSDFSLFSYSTIKNPQLRVKAIFEPIDNDPHSTVQEVILIHTFNGIIENIPNTKNYVVTGTPNLSVDNPNYAPIGIDLPIDESVLLFGIPSNVLFSNDTISSDISAIGDITIGNNVTIGPGNFTVKTSGNIYFDKSLNAIPANSSINFIAGEEIIVSPEAIVSPEVVLSIDPSIIKPCEKAEDLVPTSLEIANFCNGPIYAERSSSKSILISDVYDNLEENKSDQSVWDFNIYPNPTTSTSTVVLSGNNETNYNIEVTDMMGKVVYTKGNRAETTQTVLDLTGISKGVYFIKVNTLLGTKMKQLVIQ